MLHHSDRGYSVVLGDTSAVHHRSVIKTRRHLVVAQQWQHGTPMILRGGTMGVHRVTNVVHNSAAAPKW